jgi:small-conductance mechanosensitive channel
MKSAFLLAALYVLAVIPLLASPADSTALVQLIRVDTTICAPVVLGEDTLFLVRGGVRGHSASLRAAAVSRRIEEIAGDSGLDADSIRAVDEDFSTSIVAGDRLIMPIYDADGVIEKTGRMVLAEAHVVTIRTAVERYREARSRGTLLRGVLFSVLATALVAGILVLLFRASGRVEQKLGTRIRGVNVAGQEIIRTDWMKSLVHTTLVLARWILAFFLLYGYFQFVLTQFVWTRGLAHSLLGLFLEPLHVIGTGFLEYLPNFFFLLVLFVVTWYALKLLRFFFRELQRGRMVIPGFYPDWAMPTFKLVRIIVIALALVVAFPYLPGSNSPAFQGISIFLGVLFSLGSTSAVANMVAGVILTYMRSFRVGDFVKIQETQGVVVGSGLLVTRIRTPKEEVVTIPNASVLATHVVNYSSRAREGGVILHSAVTIGYDTPWRQVHALLLSAAERTEAVLKSPAPFVLQNSLDDFYVTYELNAYTATPEIMPQIFSDLHKHIQDAFNEYGVQIMSPNYIADRNKPTVVPPDQWYAAPARKPREPGANS